MPNLSSKELSALEDQLGFERMLCCKYQDAAQSTTETELKNTYSQCAALHKQNYETLLSFLR